MSGTLVTVEMTEIKHVSNVKKGNHSLPLCQNIVNGIYISLLCERNLFRNVLQMCHQECIFWYILQEEMLDEQFLVIFTIV
jgi:hypothetical protein